MGAVSPAPLVRLHGMKRDNLTYNCQALRESLTWSECVNIPGHTAFESEE